MHAGKGGDYEFFSGRDASRAYVTGNFTGDLNDDVADLKDKQMAGLVTWRDFYTKVCCIALCCSFGLPDIWHTSFVHSMSGKMLLHHGTGSAQCHVCTAYVWKDAPCSPHRRCPGVPPHARCQLQNYKPAGKVQGAFYDADGQAQPILHEVHAAAERHAKAEEERANKRSEAPECSRRWSQNSGMLLQEPPISSNQLITDAA